MAILASVGGVAFTGDDTQVFRVIMLKAGLKLLKVGIKPNSLWTKKNALFQASSFTGKKYKLRQIDKAIADLDTWIKERTNGQQD